MLAGTGSAASSDVAVEPNATTADGKAWAAERREERSAARCRDARRGLVYYRLRWQSWQELKDRKVAGVVDRAIPRACTYTRYLADVWRKRAYQARKSYLRWLKSHATLKDFRVCAGCNAWQRAVAEVQRVFPGTEWWLHSCASSEGGHGRWVSNSQGSGAGGWLQFMESTFWRMYGSARQHAVSRGFRVPSSANSWFSPLGQALAGAWGYTNGRRHEWVGGGC